MNILHKFRAHKTLLVSSGLLAVAVISFGALGLHRQDDGSAATGFVKYSPSDPDFPQKVDFVVTGDEVKTAPDDPIVYPGQPGAAHDHTFGCNLTVNAWSTAYSLWAAKNTNCNLTRDHAAYWIPSVYADGVKILPYQTRFYYRAGTNDVSKINTIPFGLRIIAGDAKATSAQPANIAGFQCRNLTDGNTIPKQSLPPDCPVGDFLEPSIVFPNCWDGKNLDSADHKSHMAYSQRSGSYACPSTHPVQLPQLTIAYRYQPSATSGKKVTLASMMTNSQYTLHADFMNAWDPAMLQFLIDNCIKASIACETISDTRMIPGKTPPPPSTTVPNDGAVVPPPSPTPPPPSPTPPPPSPPPADTTQPTVSLTAPAAGSSWQSGATVGLAATATDNVGVAKVGFYVDGVLKTNDSLAPYSYSWVTTGVAASSHTITAVAYDAAGNTRTSAAVTVTITSTTTVKGDANGDSRVNALDLSLVIGRDGQNFPAADFNADGTVGAADMAILLAGWTW